MKKQSNGFWISVAFGALCAAATIYNITISWWFGVAFGAGFAALNFYNAYKSYRRW